MTSSTSERAASVLQSGAAQNKNEPATCQCIRAKSAVLDYDHPAINALFLKCIGCAGVSMTITQYRCCFQSMHTQRYQREHRFEASEPLITKSIITNLSINHFIYKLMHVNLKKREALVCTIQSVTRIIFTRNVISSSSHTHTHRIPSRTHLPHYTEQYVQNP